MSYTKHTWSDGELVTAAKMNNIENGIDEASSGGGGGSSPVLLDLYDSTSQNYYLPDGWTADGWSYGSSGSPTLFAPTSNPPQSIQSALLSGNRVQIKFANLDSETPVIMECIGYCQGTSVNWYLYVMKEDGRMATIRYE